MKKNENDILFIIATFLCTLVFLGNVISLYYTEKKSDTSYTSNIKPNITTTGKPTDIEKIQQMINQNTLSSKEASFYKQIKQENRSPITENKPNQTFQRRLRHRKRNWE